MKNETIQSAVWATADHGKLIFNIDMSAQHFIAYDYTSFPLVLDDTKIKKLGVDLRRYVPKEKSGGMHKHPGAQIFIVIKGEGILTYKSFSYGDGVSENNHPIVAGEIYFVPSDISMSVESSTDELIVLVVDTDRFSK